MFALEAHGDQRYGAHPYSVHLDEVVGVLEEHIADPEPELLAMGYLHDVVEDTSVRLPTIEREFGGLVARCVDLLSDSPGETRKERKAATYARMAEVGPDAPEVRALWVKAADRLANVRRCHADGNARLLATYRGEHPAFRAAAWRSGVLPELWRELDEALR